MRDEAALLNQLHTLNESELFYRAYRLAKASPDSFEDWLGQQDLSRIHANNLLVPEISDTIPPEYLEEWYFQEEKRDGIRAFKHDCYAPPIEHFHNFFEMFYVLEGRCLHRVGENHSVLHAGDLCMIQPKVKHSIDVNDESVIIDVLIRRSTFRQYFYSILQGDNVLSNFFMSTLSSNTGMDYMIFHTGENRDLRGCFLDLCAEFMHQEAYFSTLVNAILTHIFVLMLRYHADDCELPPIKTDATAQSMDILRWLHNNMATATLEQLAEHLHYTPEYTSRLVKQQTGSTYLQLLTSIRNDSAKQYLRDTAMSIGDICSAIGFESTEHLVRLFKRQNGCTPTEYRKRNQIP